MARWAVRSKFFLLLLLPGLTWLFLFFLIPLFIVFSMSYGQKVDIIDIPLFLENKLDNKNDVIIFIKSKNSLINKKLKLRKNFNKSLVNKLRAIQLPPTKKKKMSHFTIVNDFKKNSARKSVKIVLNKIL